jgi:dTDP-4-amino-4,6-dideoxygalactose transaminase
MSRLTVPFSNLAWQWDQIRDEIMPRLEALFSSSAFCLGPYVEEFEQAFATWLGARHVVALDSGTAALHLAALAVGLGPGDEVLIPDNTFIATAWGAIYAGARPVFCDVSPETGMIDLSDAAQRMSDRVKAIIPVHLYGQPADLTAVEVFAKAHDIVVIEDSAQAHGAVHNGRKVGVFGRIGCFSFYPGKNLGAAGEAGALVTDDPEIAQRVRGLRDHGQSQRYVHQEVGFNYRMDGIQGLILTHKLRHLDTWTTMRRAAAHAYFAGLAGLPLQLPSASPGNVYHLFVIRTSRRDELRDVLQAHGIQTGLHYPIPLHRQPCFDHYKTNRDSLPVADAWARESLSLPMFAGMTDDQLAHVITTIRDFCRTRATGEFGKR